MICKTGIFILLISFLHFVCSFPTTLLTEQKCKSGNGKFPVPGSFCRSYYSCKNWIPKEIVCPGDQHFFPSKGYCVWPEEYPCLEKKESKKCPLPKGKFLKPGTECTKYYDCCNGQPTTKTCAKGLLFDHKRGKCDWPEYVTCPEGKKSKECLSPNGKFLRPGTRCKIYYDCRNGVATEKRCTGDLLFDPAGERCEWPEIYTCVEDVSTTKRTSRSTSTLITTSTPVSTSTKGKVTKVTGRTASPKITTTDSDEDSSSSESGSSEEGNSSEENKQSSTKQEMKSTSVLSTSSRDKNTEPTEIEVTISSTESTSTEENSSRTVTSTGAPEDISTISEISTSSSTDEYDWKTSTYSEILTEETHPETITEDIFTASKTESTAVSEDISTISEISTSSSTDEYDWKTSTYSEILTEETHPETITEDIATASRTESIATADDISTISEISTSSSTEDYDRKTVASTTEETHSEATNKDRFSTTVSPLITDTVTTHIFCPKPSGYFPHPYDRHKFIACIGGNPTVMDCPEKLVYDHKKRACQYE